MKRIFATAALVAALTAGSASAKPSLAAQAWHKIVPSTSAGSWSTAKVALHAMGGLLAFAVVDNFFNCRSPLGNPCGS